LQPGSPDAAAFSRFAATTTPREVRGRLGGHPHASDITHPVSFYLHPSFAKITTKEYYVRVTVRRVSAGTSA